MNENEMEQRFAAYRESLGTCGRVPQPKPAAHRRLWRTAAGTTLALVAVFALWPRDAAARALQRVATAVRNARTMDLVSQERRRTGEWRTTSHLRTSGSMWRTDAPYGPYAGTVIGRNGLLVRDLDRLDHVSVGWPEEGDPMFLAEARDALDLAKDWIDQGLVGIERKVEIRGHAPVAGRETYVVVLDRAADRYHGEIVVDAKSDLPIWAEYSVDDKPGDARTFRLLYRFNDAMASTLFDPPRDKPLVDLDREQRELTAKWSSPLAVVGETKVRDACVTADGAVWIAVTVPDLQGELDLPSAIEGPVRYARLSELYPSVGDQGFRRFKPNGEEIVVVGFVPLTPGMQATSPLRVRFTRREGRWVNSWTSAPLVEAPLGGPIGLKARREHGVEPAYFPALALDHCGISLPIVESRTRAGTLAKAENDVEAARAYEETATLDAAFIPSEAREDLRQAARLYEKAGFPKEVQRVKEALAKRRG